MKKNKTKKVRNIFTKTDRKRHFIQILATLISNAYIPGFIKGQIYQGPTKHICLPGLNCYSCPGATGACPIGAMQAVVGSDGRHFSFYVMGIMIFFGVLMGRLICGFLCPFGFLQDLLYKIRSPKPKIPKKIDRPLRYLKYGFLLIPVLLLPAFLKGEFGIAPPYFCQWICPVGILEGGIPLLLTNNSIQEMIGSLFFFKASILAAVLIGSIFIFRPFCKYICPLGAFYGLFNAIGFYQLTINRETCTNCKACERICPMNVPILRNINSPECIRCGKCQEICPEKSISVVTVIKKSKRKKTSSHIL